MSATREFYLTRAAESAIEAQNATLDNVRERCLRSEAVWREMADRISVAEEMRETTTRAKAAELATAD